ncbi:serine hydrolase [Spirosoma spitsbergense]|uniref:serine hydrolase n=1 Tax=Spirosoma spitsbergense TaxID=431554 RepID=UPI000379B6CE|nr:serine hydrolase [Spirosoma spitsbergense]
MKYTFTTLLLLWLISASFSQSVSPEVAKKMKQVETSLMPAVQLADKPPVRYTIAERMRQFKVPAVSIAVVNNGKLEWANAYGYLSIDSTRKADTETLFQAASISKPVSALGALKLVEQGKLSLDTDINQYLTSWKIKPSRFTAQKPVTLRGLLSHTAGLTVHGFPGYPKGRQLPTTAQILNGEKPANSPAVVSDTVPGARNEYSGGGYVVMQQAVEDVTGKPFATFMQETVLSSLGMRHSTYAQPLPEAMGKNVSVAHWSTGRKLAGDWNTYPETAPAGLWTTPSDLALYILEVQQSIRGNANHVLSASMTKTMLTRQLGNQGLGPGLNGENSTASFGHGGGNMGYRCFLYAFSESGQGAVIMTNSDNGMDVINDILRSIAYVYNWPDFKSVTRKVATVQPDQLDKLVGRYEGYGDKKPVLEITRQDAGLQVRQTWDNHSFTLLPESDLSFFVKDEGGPFTFETAADGTINTLLAFGHDRWTRVK